MDERQARAVWARLAEPEDRRAHALVTELGYVESLEYLSAGGRHGERFRGRLVPGDFSRDLDLTTRCGARIVIPGDVDWPPGLDELELPPHCLWVRGPLSPGRGLRRSAAIVGARAATAYGEQVAAELGAGMAERGFAVVSGAALGIDVAAQLAALTADGPVVAVLANGVDRAYPARHEGLLDRIAETGAVISEVPPGGAPMRNRFLARNRLIAAMSAGTCVVEAGLRSGALSTAHRALDLGRPVAAVPGPVTSMVSAGCHQLVRDGKATLVTEAAELAELVGDLGADACVRPRGVERPEDHLEPTSARVFAALPVRRGATADQLVRSSGLTMAEVLAALGEMSLTKLVESDRGTWRRAPSRVAAP